MATQCETISKADYICLEEGSPGPNDIPSTPRLLARLSGSLKSPNLLAKGREYLTEQMTPPKRGPLPGTPEIHKVDSSQLLHDNAALHNAHVESDATDGSILRPLEAGGLRTGVLTLVATALGSGVLALPFAFAHTGFVMALVVLIVTACASCVSLIILMMASRYTDADSYAALLAIATESKAAGLLLDAMQVCYGCAVVLALLIFEADFVPAILEGVGLPKPGRTTAILYVAAGVAPLMIPTKVTSLRYVAALAPFAILLVSGIVAAQTPSFYAKSAEDSKPKMFVLEPLSMLQSTCIFVFAFMCHANAIPVVHSLDRPSVARIVKVASYANACNFGLYIVIGFAGYFSFQASVQGDFLLNYPAGDKSILLCRLMMAVVCYIGIPLNSANCVRCFQKCLTAVAQQRIEPEMEERPVLFAVLAMVMLGITTAGAICCHNVAIVLSLVGGSLTTIQMFWIPAFVYWKLLYRDQPKGFRFVVMATMVCAGMLGFANVLTTVASMF